jgi:hypothetical protein
MGLRETEQLDFLSTAWLMLAVFILFSGGISSPAMRSHIAVIVVSAWLVGRRAAIGLPPFLSH